MFALPMRAALSSLALATVLTACGDDPTPTPAPVSQPSMSASDALEALPSTFSEYRLLAELDPAGRESMLEKAIETLTEEIRKDSTNVEGYVKRGAAYTALHYYSGGRDRDESLLEQPLEDFAKAIDLDPSNAGAYIGRGEAYYNWKQLDRARQEYDTAIQLLSEAIRLDLKDTESYIARAKAYRFRRDPDKAIQDLDAAISLDPGNPEAYYVRARAYSQKGEGDNAIQNYDMVIRLDPNFIHAYNERADKYRQKDELVY